MSYPARAGGEGLVNRIFQGKQARISFYCFSNVMVRGISLSKRGFDSFRLMPGVAVRVDMMQNPKSARKTVHL